MSVPESFYGGSFRVDNSYLAINEAFSLNQVFLVNGDYDDCCVKVKDI